MNESHVLQIAELEKLCFNDPWSEKSIATELNSKLSCWLVAMEGDALVGYVGSQSVLGESDMMNIAVHPKYRRKGIAEALVQNLISQLKGKNVIIAVDGCCPDNEERAAKGYRMTEPLKVQLRQNLVKLQEFGAVLTTAGKIANKTLRVIGAAEATVPTATCGCTDLKKTKAAPAAAKVTRKVVGRQDVVNLPAGSVLKIPAGSQVTQLAMDIIRVNRIQLVRE